MTALATKPKLDPLFPYFGGKSRVAAEVWRRLGVVRNYVEPFFGSGAMMFGCPYDLPLATVNDANGYVANFWRAVKHAPDELAEWADWPVNENDLHARHVWLVERMDTLAPLLEGDPDWYDAKVAGWWCWGMCNWIGSGFCTRRSGPWWPVVDEDGRRKLVHLGNNGKGVSRKRVHLGGNGTGVSRKRVHLGDNGTGVSRKLVHLGDWVGDFADRLREVRVCSGDWSRVCGPCVTFKHGTTAVFLDPPYLFETGDGKKRNDSLYGDHDSDSVAHDVREWCLANGDNPKLRIALCGYEGEHEMPGWSVWAWKAAGGYASKGSNGQNNSKRERIWFSPHCLADEPGGFLRGLE